ncbi:MAG: S41 family peptidase [Lachnospiraceae bacterium]|nr:S41 family peptidase [Lachnospiraceae bacterium]
MSEEFETQEISGEQPTMVTPMEPIREAAAPRRSFAKGVLVGVLLSMIVVLIGGLLLFVVYRSNQKPESAMGTIVNEECAKKVDFISSIIDQYYYEDVNEDDLREGVYAGLVSGLKDPYSAYYSPEEYEQLEISTTGNYAGIGAGLQKDPETGMVSISRIYEGSPAEKAGLKKGDILISADGELAVDMEADEFAARVRGEKGTSVELVYERDGKQETISVTREEINIPSVQSLMLNDQIGYVQIGEFVTGTPKEFEEAITSLQSQGAKAFVFDVRDNPGGMVDSVTDMLDYILPEGTTLYMEEKDGTRTYYDSDAKQALDAPMVVLTNGNSASASEIFAGAIHDFKAGTLIGTKTFGKGVVQVTLPLTDGSAVKLTIARYFTPSGVCIHGEGIQPDVELEYEYSGDEEAEEYDYHADNQINKAIEVLTEEIEK